MRTINKEITLDSEKHHEENRAMIRHRALGGAGGVTFNGMARQGP